MEASLPSPQSCNHFLKHGKVLKQSKCLQVWPQRYLILTQTHLFTFKTKQYNDPPHVIDLSHLVFLKSHAPSSHDPTINDFTLETTLYSITFRCHSSPEKWSWIVAIERVLDLRAKGGSYYNSVENLMRGFASVNEFNRSYPDGPSGKYFGNELIKLIQAVYEMGVREIKAEKLKYEKEEGNTECLVLQSKRVTEGDIKYYEINQTQQPFSSQLPQASTPTAQKSRIEQFSVIPKGKVSKIAQVYEHKLEEQEAAKRRDSFTNHNSYQGNLRKQRMIRGLLDEFEDTTCLNEAAILLEVIVNLLCEESCQVINQIRFQSLNGTKRANFTETFTQHYLTKNDQISSLRMLKFFSLIYITSPNFFSLSQLHLLKSAFVKCLEVDNCEIRKLAIGNIEMMKQEVGLSEEEIVLIEKKEMVNMGCGNERIKSEVDPQNNEIEEVI